MIADIADTNASMVALCAHALTAVCSSCSASESLQPRWQRLLALAQWPAALSDALLAFAEFCRFSSGEITACVPAALLNSSATSNAQPLPPGFAQLMEHALLCSKEIALSSDDQQGHFACLSLDEVASKCDAFEPADVGGGGSAFEPCAQITAACMATCW